MLDCLQLLNFYLGSQLLNIRNIRGGMLEACRYYVELVQEGVPLQYLDLGGGLAVDYDGSQSNNTHSMNYSLNEYCADIVKSIMEALDPHNIYHPVIITESGRATVAYSSVLLFNILDVSHFDPKPLPDNFSEEHHELIHNLFDVCNSVGIKPIRGLFWSTKTGHIYFGQLIVSAVVTGMIPNQKFIERM